MVIDPEDLHVALPERPAGVGVLVLAGSSGRLDAARADRLAAGGRTALAFRWFGGRSGPVEPREVPIERLVEALDLLAMHADRLGVIGLSHGAEAALVLATIERRLDGVVALAPTDVVWEGAARPGAPAASKRSFDAWYVANREIATPEQDRGDDPGGADRRVRPARRRR